MSSATITSHEQDTVDAVATWRQARVHLQRVLAVCDGITAGDNPVRIPQEELVCATGDELRAGYDTSIYPAARELARQTRRALVRARAAEAAAGAADVAIWVPDPETTAEDTDAGDSDPAEDPPAEEAPA